MAGLDPAIHVFSCQQQVKNVDARDKRGDDQSICINFRLYT
jgi:hypothetical protein